MKYLFGTIVITLIALSFVGPKCDHVFTQVEQAEIKIAQPPMCGYDNLLPTWYNWPAGKKEGKELICVKCFIKQKQILDYGPPPQQDQIHLSDFNQYGCCDTVNVTSTFKGAILLKGDSLIWGK